MSRAAIRRRIHSFWPHVLGGLLALAMCVSLEGVEAGDSGTSGTQVDPTVAPPPNVLFMLDLTPAMDENCVYGIPCLEDVKKAILESRRHNNWVNTGVIGTSSSTAFFSYYPIAPLGTSAAELARTFRSVTTSSTAGNFGQSIYNVTWFYLRYGFWKSLWAPTNTEVIQASCQETHVITITKSLPNDDPYAYDAVASWLYNTDLRTTMEGVQNVITHTIHVGGLADDKNYSGATVVTKGQGLYITANSYQELEAGISQVMKSIRSDKYIRSATVVNTDQDLLLYSYQEAWPEDPLPIGNLYAYRVQTDPSSADYGTIIEDPTDPYGGAVWSAGDLLATRSATSGEVNPLVRTGKTPTRAIYTFIESAATTIPSTATAVEGLNHGRMSLDANFVRDVASSPDMLKKFIRKEGWGICTNTDFGVTIGSPVNIVKPGTGAVIDASFSCDLLSVTVDSTKSLTNVVLRFETAATQSFTGLTANTGTFKGTGAYNGVKIVGAWVKSGDNKCTGAGCCDICGEYIGNLTYPEGCGYSPSGSDCGTITSNGQKKYLLCHVPPGNPGNAHTITIAQPAVVRGHLKNHIGDHLGPCDTSDLTGDDVIDGKDLQVIVDFVRGVSTTPVKYVQNTRGDWKLGPSERAVPTVVTAQSEVFAVDDSYSTYLQTLKTNQEDGAPDIVLQAANDGMLHAFNLETGEELWAWVPAQVLNYDQPVGWSGRMIEQVWYGQTSLFDGTTVVDDVWIDDNSDGKNAPDGSEWHRVAIVQQGEGGPATLALDITNPADPVYLWETTSLTTDPSATGHTVSRPLMTTIEDRQTVPGVTTEVPVAIWATGKGAATLSPVDNYSKSEANIIIKNVADNFWGDSNVKYDVQGSNGHPASGTAGLDLDADGRKEQAYIAGALAAVDSDGDGTVDVIYFPVSTTYEPADLGDPDKDGITGTADVAQPGYTWIYKAIIDPADPDNPTWTVFYDPKTAIGKRPEVFFSATATWMEDGTLGLFWGTGGPESRGKQENGYIFAQKDPAPTELSTAVPVEGFGDTSGVNVDKGILTLSPGEVLTWEPILYAGTLYFTTYIPACATCNTGESRVYGISYTSGGGNLDLDGDGVAESMYLLVDGPVGSFKISDQGVLFFGTSRSSATGSSSIAVGSISLSGASIDEVRPVSWAELW